MKVPGFVLSNSKIVTYGGGALELDPGIQEPGCPRLYHHRYELGNKDDATRSWQLEYGSTVHLALYYMEEEALGMDDALQKAWPADLGIERFEEALDDLRNVVERGGIMTQIHTVAVEETLTAPLYEDEDFGPISYTGIIDYIGVPSDLETNPSLIFSDYKTNRHPPSRADMKQWRQGYGYAFLVRENSERWLKGDVKIVGMFDAVKWYTLDMEYTDDSIDVWQQWAISVARTILRDDDPKPRLNQSCTWCDIRDTCPAWQALPGDGDTLLERVSEVPLGEKVARLDELKKVQSRIKSEIDSTNSVLRGSIERSGDFTDSDGNIWRLEDADSRVPDPKLMHGIMGDDFYDLATIGVTKVDKWSKEHLDVKPKVDAAIAKRAGSPRLKKYDIAEILRPE